MKIVLSAIDSKMANYAILKIAQHHINKGDTVKWYEPLFDQDADILYVSKIFTFTQDIENVPPNAEIIKGGTGYSVDNKLPLKMEYLTNVEEAYQTLYPNLKYSIVFTTRGCVRNCEFCLVRQKEGLTHDIEPISKNPNGEHIEVLDNNFFSNKTWKKRLEYLKKLNQPINFNTGIDVRLLTEEQAKALSQLKIKRIHIAWDYYPDKEKVLKGIKTLTKHVKPYKVTCYVLVGFDNKKIVETDIERVEKIWSYGVYPFAMGYIDFNDPTYVKPKEINNFARWVNRFYFKKLDFKDYK